MSTIEHISRFLIQCGECRNRCSEDSFGGTLAVWIGLCMVLRLACKFQYHMADLKMQCHKYFFAGVHEMKITNMTAIKQRNDEPITNYIQWFRDIRSRCFSLSLSDSQLAEFAFQGLLPHIKERFSSHEFESLSHLA